MHGLIRLTAVGSFLVVGCAHSAPRMSADGQPLHSIRAVDERPELLGCARYTPPGRGMASRRVQASFTVTATGAVQNVMIGRITPTTGPQRVAPDIRDIVSSCTYLPAVLNGVAVGVFDASRTFYVAVNDLGYDDIMDRRGRKVEAGGDDDQPARPVEPPPRDTTAAFPDRTQSRQY
jgi:hypothetical protein